LADTALGTTDHHYREGSASLALGSGFFRPDSRPSRDCSVLLARHQHRHAQGQLRWLDLMAGCGIRSLRWGLEALQERPERVELWVNDGDPDRLPCLNSNLSALPRPARVSSQAAEVLLGQAYLDGRFFDLIDLDAFGAPGSLIQPALQALRFEGLLLLASTDGRSPTGHDRAGAIRSLGAAARVHPASWELALRHQLGLVARQAWMLGRGIQPLLCFSEGRTFRVSVRMRRHLQPGEEHRLGLLARCEACGSQVVQILKNLTGWPSCCCPSGAGRWSVSGPLWIGPLQDSQTLAGLRGDPWLQEPGAISNRTKRLLERLEADPGSPATVWATDELARRLGGGGPPPLNQLVTAVRQAGFQAYPSGVMAGQLRTDADLTVLLRLCADLRSEGT
jgi:tRNA (guanine26-N2/guanine27-N2)-dimethyltransferase